MSAITVQPATTNALEFWCIRHIVYSKLYVYALAEDLLSSPASQAYAEDIFSLRGMLTAVCRNRIYSSLEMMAFLKLNVYQMSCNIKH